uniref:Uncharacterized protein n=1 Tax=Prymnesium polylepis TaxID=72548 RepID=A0A6T8B2Z9_9EUKA|mmetsp:Transcript_34294/g.86091  ORF Transcript_34294/g.86091 Transcript_34294/m.86091 type:complete len:279 (+) Transcript_34294:31-867(+)
MALPFLLSCSSWAPVQQIAATPSRARIEMNVIGNLVRNLREHRANEFRGAVDDSAVPHSADESPQPAQQRDIIRRLEASFRLPLRRIPGTSDAFVPGPGLFLTLREDTIAFVDTDRLSAALSERRRLEAEQQAADDLAAAAAATSALAAARSVWVERAAQGERCLASLLQHAPVEAASLRRAVDEARAAGVGQRAPHVLHKGAALLQLVERDGGARGADAFEDTWRVLFRYEPGAALSGCGGHGGGAAASQAAVRRVGTPTIDVAGIEQAVSSFMDGM